MIDLLSLFQCSPDIISLQEVAVNYKNNILLQELQGDNKNSILPQEPPPNYKKLQEQHITRTTYYHKDYKHWNYKNNLIITRTTSKQQEQPEILLVWLSPPQVTPTFFHGY